MIKWDSGNIFLLESRASVLIRMFILDTVSVSLFRVPGKSLQASGDVEEGFSRERRKRHGI